MKSVRIWSYSGLHFPALGLNTERYSLSLRILSKYGENTEQNKSEYGHFLRSAIRVRINYSTEKFNISKAFQGTSNFNSITGLRIVDIRTCSMFSFWFSYSLYKNLREVKHVIY